MKRNPVTLPGRTALEHVLVSLLQDESLEVVEREPNVYSRTYPSEVVRCRLVGGKTKTLFFKYSGTRENSQHHRGVRYEAEIYRTVLQSQDMPTVHFYGSYEDPDSGWTWLVLEYLRDASTINQTPELILAAARWIGRFHATMEPHATNPPRVGFPRWSDSESLAWARRTESFARFAPDDIGTQPITYQNLAEGIYPLRAARPTVIHGEYYPLNVLACNGRVLPVDWESAAIGAGELDLAALTDGWSPEVVEQCKQAYRESRWPQLPPEMFETVFSAAQLYWHLRWIGATSSWSSRKGMRWRWRALARRVGSLSREPN